MIILLGEALDVSTGVLRVIQRIPDAVWRPMPPAMQQGIRDDLVDALLQEAANRDLTLIGSPIITETYDPEGIID